MTLQGGSNSAACSWRSPPNLRKHSPYHINDGFCYSFRTLCQQLSEITITAGCIKLVARHSAGEARELSLSWGVPCPRKGVYGPMNKSDGTRHQDYVEHR